MDLKTKHKTLAGFFKNHPRSNSRIKNWLQREKELGKMPLNEFVDRFLPTLLLRFHGIGKKTYHNIVSIFQTDKLLRDINPEIQNFSVRIKNLLIDEKLTTKKAVTDAICEGKLYPGRIYGYSWTSHKVLCEWTGTKKMEIEELPGRIKNMLLRRGLTTRAAVKDALLQGELHPSRITVMAGNLTKSFVNGQC